VDLHLVGIDARDALKDLQARLPELETLARDVGRGSAELGDEIARVVRGLGNTPERPQSKAKG
jgi:hypothetical protein